MKIIDGHCHYLPPAVAERTTFYKAGWSDIDGLLTTMDRFGIERAVLYYPTSDAHVAMGGWLPLARTYNDCISRVVREHPDRLIGAGILSVDSPAEMLTELKRFAELNLKVISLASSYEGRFLDDERFVPVFEYAQERGLPVHVHPQIMSPIGEERVRDPLLSPVLEYVFDVAMCIGKLLMEGVFRKFPDVKFIFAHYGGVLPFVKERFDNTYLMLLRRNYVKDLLRPPSQYFRNLYFDMSGSKSVAALLCALEVVDPRHIIFGSDLPANQNAQDTIAVVERSALSDLDKRSILADNLIGILDPQKICRKSGNKSGNKS